MEDTIELMLTLSRLNDNEIGQFMLNTIQIHGKQLISKLFFSYCMNNPINKDMINTHTQNATDIIKSRETKSKQIIYNRIDKLPSDLMGKCASYLSQQQFFRFALSNRTIFTAIHNPLRLHHLILSKHWPIVKSREKFESVKNLFILFPVLFSQIYKFKHTSITEYTDKLFSQNSLNSLMLHNGFVEHQFMQSFLNNNIINFNTIKQLRLYGFVRHKSLSPCYNFDTFCNILSRLQMVQHLHINSLFLSNGFVNENDIVTWLPNLRHFYCKTAANNSAKKLVNAIINAVGHKFESLAVRIDIIDHVSHGFPKLQQLHLFIDDDDVDNIDLHQLNKIKTKLLKRVQIQFSSDCEEETMRPIIDFMIMKQTLLERIQIILKEPNHFKCVIDQMICSLFKSKKIHRHQLFIGIIIATVVHTNNFGEIVKNMPQEMFKLLSVLSQLKIDNFMVNLHFQCVFNLSNDNAAMKNWLKELNDLHGKYSVYYNIDEECIRTFVVSNKNCKINGNGVENLNTYQLES